MKSNKYSKDELIQIINNGLLEYLDENNKYSEILIESKKYSLISKGKRLRPLLCIGASNICNGDLEQVLPYAIAIEYIHTYSLIHDDMPCMDNDDYRRGELTNHKKFGENIALLAGDSLLTCAMDILSNELLKDPCYEKAKAMKLYSSCAEKMILGQIVDIRWNKYGSLDDILFVHENKTGALIYAACTVGAIVSGASNKQYICIENYAKAFGIAFQIADDINDMDAADEPNYVNIVGFDKATEDCNYYLNLAKEAIASWKGNELLLSLVDMVKDSIK